MNYNIIFLGVVSALSLVVIAILALWGGGGTEAVLELVEVWLC